MNATIQFKTSHNKLLIYKKTFYDHEALCSWVEFNKEIVEIVEEWQWIRGYEKLYAISNFGRVKSYRAKKPAIMRGTFRKSGYHRCDLRKDGKRKTVSIHCLVANHFIHNPDPDNLLEVDHINRVRDDNVFWNLRWSDREMNMANRKFYKEYPL